MCSMMQWWWRNADIHSVVNADTLASPGAAHVRHAALRSQDQFPTSLQGIWSVQWESSVVASVPMRGALTKEWRATMVTWGQPKVTAAAGVVYVQICRSTRTYVNSKWSHAVYKDAIINVVVKIWAYIFRETGYFFISIWCSVQLRQNTNYK